MLCRVPRRIWELALLSPSPNKVTKKTCALRAPSILFFSRSLVSIRIRRRELASLSPCPNKVTKKTGALRALLFLFFSGS